MAGTKPDDGGGGGGTTALSESFLKDFANKNLAGLVSGLSSDPAVQKLAEFASGGSGQSGPGIDPSGGASGLLPGNDPNNLLSSGAMLQSKFQTLASTLYGQITNLITSAKTMQIDLLEVDKAMNAGEDAANISAGTMAVDLGNVDIVGAGPTPSGATVVAGPGGGPLTGGVPAGGGSSAVPAAGSSASTTK